MAYTDIISVADAKNYLRIDDTLSNDDQLIAVIIDTAFQYIEKYTNVICVARDKTYTYEDNHMVRVYDAPINTETLPDHTEEYFYELYSIFEVSNSDIKDITLNVGYELATDVPSDIIMVAYELIDILYYGKETGKSMEDLSPLSRQTLDLNKRFLL